jgi:hypothetical protein
MTPGPGIKAGSGSSPGEGSGSGDGPSGGRKVRNKPRLSKTSPHRGKGRKLPPIELPPGKLGSYSPNRFTLESGGRDLGESYRGKAFVGFSIRKTFGGGSSEFQTERM